MYENELAVAIEIAREAGEETLKYYDSPLKVESKLHEDDYAEPVTEADRVANDLIVRALKREFPSDGILAEESEDDISRLEKKRTWVIDPIDGTSGFINRTGDFAIQIGLAEEGESVLGVVYQPLQRVLYYASKGNGTWIESSASGKQRATVSDKSDLADMILAASYSHYSPKMNKVIEAFKIKEVIRRGSVGLKVGLIVSSESDLYVHLSPRTKEWDICAPEIILREAGGKFTDIFGRPFTYNTADPRNPNGIVASNGAAHERIIKKLAPLLREFGREPV